MPRQAKNAKQPKRGPGQPPKNIDLKQLETLCALHCTDEEICAVLGFSTKTLERRKHDSDVQEAMARGKAKGRVSLRRKQIEVAMNGDRTMLIWCGKQILGQRDRIPEEEPDEKPTERIEYVWVNPEEGEPAAEKKETDVLPAPNPVLAVPDGTGRVQ